MLPEKAKGFDVISDIMDHLTKSAHFLVIQESSSAEKLADMYVCKIVAKDGVPNQIYLTKMFDSLHGFYKGSTRNWVRDCTLAPPITR